MTRYDRTRDALGALYPVLDRERPAIADLAARVLATWHDRLSGRVADITSVLSAKHVREMLRGERSCASLLLAAELALDEPEAFAAGISEAAAAAGFELRPLGQAVPGRNAALVRAIREHSEAVATAIAAEGDDTVDEGERREILREMDEAAEALAQARAAYARPAGRGQR